MTMTNQTATSTARVYYQEPPDEVDFLWRQSPMQSNSSCPIQTAVGAFGWLPMAVIPHGQRVVMGETCQLWRSTPSAEFRLRWERTFPLLDFLHNESVLVCLGDDRVPRKIWAGQTQYLFSNITHGADENILLTRSNCGLP